MEKLRARGLEIYTDVMPTTTSFTHLFAYFPPWAVQGTKNQVAARLANPQKRKEMLHDILNGEMIWPHTRKNTWSLNLLKIMGWECVRIMSVVSERTGPWREGESWTSPRRWVSIRSMSSATFS